MTIASLTVGHGQPELNAGARSQVYRLLADAFTFPDDGFQENVVSGKWSEEIALLADHLPFDLENGSAPPVSLDAAQAGYISAFEVGPGKPYCPLYEGYHRDGRMKLMEELVRFYEHFGLRTTPGDQPDHLCAEFEFMHYMAFKEAAAVAHREVVDDLRRAEGDFLDRHLCRWLPRLRARIASASILPEFYTYLAELADGFARRDLAFLRAT